MNKTACPLDCFDACSVIYEEGRLKGDSEHALTRGALCPNLNHFLETPRIEQARYQGEAVSMEKALELLDEMIGSDPAKTLLYRSAGNMGLMQQSMDYVLGSMGATLTRGNLCDGAGAAGIEEGRGVNYALSPEQIAEAEVVVLWGRNPHASNSHILPFIRGKQLIVIDPCTTRAAQEADLHIQLRPHGDLYLALLCARFAIIHGHFDEAFVEEHVDEVEEFYELTQTVRIKNRLEMIDVSLGQIGKFLEMITNKKTVFLVGVGVQKYRNGDEVLRAIDSFAAVMGLFGKPGCGVSYLGSSMQGIENPFAVKTPRVGKVNAEFSDFKTVIIQGANPLSQMPDTARVRKSIEGVDNVVYFGLYENESSELADLVIPARSFLGKEDIRASYGSDEWLMMPKVIDGDIGISEYELAAHLAEKHGVALKEESEYIGHFRAQCEERDGRLFAKGRPEMPYRDGFETDEEAFLFIEEFDLEFDTESDYFLVTAKSPNSLNSQFRRESRVYLHPKSGFAEGERVRLSSENGSVEMEVGLDEGLREDCVLIYSGTPGANNLTTSAISFAGEAAAYQENKIKVEKC